MNILKSYITLNDLIGRYIVAQKSIDVSVIIPTFNRAALLRLGLHSIFSQNTSHSYEVIVVDDGNDKETPEVCQYYANTIQNRFMYLGLRRHIISNPMWRVPSFAINAGVRRASGKYVVLACPEMYWGPTVLQELGDLLSQHPHR